MKRFGLMVVFLLVLAAPAFADNGVGDVSVYADDQGNSCDVTNPGSGIINVYIVHKFLPGEEATASRFKVEFPSGILFLAFSTSFVPLGTLTTDISIGYGVCVTSNTHIGTALCQGVGPTTACSYITVANADILPNPISTTCLFEERTMGAGQAIVNNDGSCPCNIAAESTSWGRVKALYR